MNNNGSSAIRKTMTILIAILIVSCPSAVVLSQGQVPAGGRGAGPSIQAATTSATQKELKEVLAQIADLKEKLKKLESSNLRLSFQLSYLQNRNRTVSLDPASPKKYQRFDSQDGFFVVSFENAEPYLDGYRVAIEIGNLSSARYVGFKLDTTWGPRYDWEKSTEESYKKWEELRQKKEFTFTNPLLPGTWNKVELILPATKASQVGFIELSITTDTISFGTR